MYTYNVKKHNHCLNCMKGMYYKTNSVTIGHRDSNINDPRLSEKYAVLNSKNSSPRVLNSPTFISVLKYLANLKTVVGVSMV